MIVVELILRLLKILNHPLNKKNKFATFCRIIWWKINRFLFHLPVIIYLNNNIQCICYPINLYSDLIVYYTLPEYPEMILTKEVLKNKSIFFDIGANMGVFTLLAASKIKQGKIFAFEPIPQALRMLYQNIRINNLDDRVTVLEKVASDKDGLENFNIENFNEFSYISANKGLNNITVSSVRLDTFCKKNNIRFIDLIKIDVEGAEMMVLKGLEELLKKGNIGMLIIELNAGNKRYGSDSQKTLNYLRRFNYLIYQMDNTLKFNKVLNADNNNTYNIVAVHIKKKKSLNALFKF